MTDRRALVLVEVLVVIGVLAILAALLLPAIQVARSASRRVYCSSNLRGLGIACAAYESTYGWLPEGAGKHSIHFQLLPWMERNDLFDAYRPALSPFATENQWVRSQTVPHFLCPEANPRLAGEVAVTSYAANVGDGNWSPPFGRSGVFHAGAIRVAEILDGTSRTAAFSEWIAAGTPIGRRQGGRLRTLEPGGYPDRLSFLADCLDESAFDSQFFSGLGVDWVAAMPGATLYNHQLLPNNLSCTTFKNPLDQLAFTASSHHGFGVHLLYCDGRVDWIAESIDGRIWKSVATKAGPD